MKLLSTFLSLFVVVFSLNAANPAFQDRLKREVPLGRLVSAREDAMFVAYLASVHADCFVGQVFPVCGGWVPR